MASDYAVIVKNFASSAVWNITVTASNISTLLSSLPPPLPPHSTLDRHTYSRGSDGALYPVPI